ncbi:MAG: GMC family oxidoreductase [Deltaproteobacteria bacterium]|nr:GMC family oxidoreductase [Deltaproteobacteria bacterium]MBW2362481.1 GMC family oxidoreductase [Deltaproteobacteria bacterium]
MSSESPYDAIVVGSGISGGWAAKELTERGLRVLMLERGRPLEHGSGYVGEHRAPWQFPFRGKGDRKLIDAHYGVSKSTASVEEGNLQFWARDEDIPYQSSSEQPFRWVRTDVFGGRSLVWGRQVYRWSDLDFEANAQDGHGVDWPIRYGDIAPWYDHVEDFIGVSGRAEGLPQLPDGRFLPPMDFNCVEAAAKQRIEAAFPERRMTIGRVAVLTREHRGRAPCHYCLLCQRGCSTASYFSTQGSTLPAAQQTGRLEVRTRAIVEKLAYDAKTRRVTGVHVIDADSNERHFFGAKLVFLCASTLGSTQILLNSRSEHAPNGLANSSGVLGHHLMDHTFGTGAVAVMPGFESTGYKGHRPNGTYIPRFRNVDEPHGEFTRGYGYQGMAIRFGWGAALSQPGFGAEWKQTLTSPGPWLMLLAGFGECLPNPVNRARLSETHRDRWGIPQLDIHMQWSDNERAMCKDMQAEAIAMLKAAGGVNIIPLGGTPGPGGDAIHEMGTARMGRNPRTSVLNGFNQAHDVANLFVTDGSAMTSSACQNPSITYMALTARACEYAVKELESGALA